MNRDEFTILKSFMAGAIRYRFLNYYRETIRQDIAWTFSRYFYETLKPFTDGFLINFFIGPCPSAVHRISKLSSYGIFTFEASCLFSVGQKKRSNSRLTASRIAN